MGRLFTSQTPSSVNNSDGTPGIVSAFTFSVADDGVVNGVYIFTTTTVGGTYTALLYQVTSSDPGTGTLLDSKVYSGSTPTGGAWLYIAFDDPVPVTAGVAYRAGVHNSEGRYVATLNFFNTPLTNDGITAPEHNGTVGGFTVSQGVFRIDASPGYPNSPGGGETNYFADVDYNIVDNTVTPDGLAVPVALGAPSVNSALTVSPDGLAVPATLGAPTAGQPSAAPDSLAVTTALGQPAVTPAASAPDGLAAPVALGEPAVTTAYTVAPDGLAVPLTLGAPAIVRTAAPDGLAVSVSLGAPTVGQATGSAGWSDFGGIIQGAIEDARINAEERRNPVACPYDGWPLQQNSRGEKHCLFGGHIVTGE